MNRNQIFLQHEVWSLLIPHHLILIFVQYQQEFLDHHQVLQQSYQALI